jgi:hypothetical protein
MTPSSQPDDRAPLSSYVDGDPDAVRAARPPEPGEVEWDEVRQRIHARLAARPEPSHPPRAGRTALWAGVGAALTAAAAVVAWTAFGEPVRQPDAPGVAEIEPVPKVPVAPAPHEAQPDPLAEFAVLPMASSDEVVLHRVPGDGWLPVGAHPLPGVLALATSSEVELDDPEEAWPNATTAPDRVPMIFAAKPR